MNNKKKNITTNTTPGTIPKKSRVLENRTANTFHAKETAKSAIAGTSKQASGKKPLKKPAYNSNKSVDPNTNKNIKRNPKIHQNLSSESADLSKYYPNDAGTNKINAIRTVKSMSHSNITAYAQKNNTKPKKCDVVDSISVKSLPDSAMTDDNALTKEPNIVAHESRKLDFRRQALALMTSLFPDDKPQNIWEQKDTRDKETQTISQDYAIEVPKLEKQSLISTSSSHIIETSIPINGTNIRLSIQIPKEKSQLELHQQLHEVKSDIADMKLILNNLKSDMQAPGGLENNLVKLAVLENEIKYVTITNNENESIEEAEIEQIDVVNTASKTNKLDTANLTVTTCKVNKTIKTIQINSSEANDEEQIEKEEQKRKEDTTTLTTKEAKCKAEVSKNIKSDEQEIYPLDIVVTRKEKEVENSAARTKVIENKEMKGVISAKRAKNKADKHLKKALLSGKVTVTKEEKKQCGMEFGTTNEKNKNGITISLAEKVIENTTTTLTQNPKKLKKIEEAKSDTKIVVKRNEELEGAVGFVLDDEASVYFDNALDGMVFVKGTNVIHFSKDPNNEKMHFPKIQIDRHERKQRTTHGSLPDISQITQEKSKKRMGEVTRIDRIKRELNNFVASTYIE